MEDEGVEVYCDKCYAEYNIRTDLGPEYVPTYCAFCGEDIDIIQMQSEMIDWQDDEEET